MSNLYDKLKNNKTLPMHMPGHKRNAEKFPYLSGMCETDITEIDGFDNLHSPSGILKESMQKASECFSSEKSIYLVNGSTCGILASILAICTSGDKIIMSRQSHKSVYNAVNLSGAIPVYLTPDTNNRYSLCAGVSADMVEKQLSLHPDSKLIVITSPTYEGVISDIGAICEVAKKYNVPVLVDGAHGAHLGLGRFPKSAQQSGADIVVASLHKTLPSLTQTAILCTTEKYYDKICDMLSILETSSPSYILMASIDSCIDAIKNGAVDSWYEALERFYKKAESLKNLKLLKKSDGFFDYDISKITIMTSSPLMLAKGLRENNIEPEMVSGDYVLCMTGAGDDDKSLDALLDVLNKLDRGLFEYNKRATTIHIPKMRMTSKEARRLESQHIDVAESLGKTSAEYVMAYPPGIPIIVPGEVIDEKIIALFSEYEENGITLTGGRGYKSGKILVTNT